MRALQGIFFCTEVTNQESLHVGSKLICFPLVLDVLLGDILSETVYSTIYFHQWGDPDLALSCVHLPLGSIMVVLKLEKPLSPFEDRVVYQ